MFCSNCGNEIKDGEAFCPKCGARIGTNQTFSGGQGAAPASGNGPGRQILNNLNVGFESLGKNRIWYFLCLILQILCVIFLALPMFQIEVEGYLVKKIVTVVPIKLFEGRNLAMALAIVLYCISILAAAWPMVSGKQWKRSGFLFCAVLPVVSIIYFLVAAIQTNRTMSDEFGAYKELIGDMLHFSITPEGWVFLVLCLAAVVVAYTNWCFAGEYAYAQTMAKKRKQSV